MAQTVAFPGAFGFGAYATGGRNGTVYHVTTLADSGAGSFRTGVSSGNRTIVFDVGGEIKLLTAVSCSSSLTIAGQTAPGGIVIDGGEVSFANRNNIICRYLRIRPGSDPSVSSSDDALSFYRASNIIVDHSSIAFAPWNNIDGVGDSTHLVTGITVQHSINANPTGQQFGAHTESVGGQWSWHYNLFANSHNRNPLAKINTTFINNLEYNNSAGYTTHTSTHFKHDIVNNYFVDGPASGGNFPWYQIDSNQSIYYAGNLHDSDQNTTLNGTATTPYWYSGTGTILSSPWSSWTTVIPTMTADLAWRYDVSTAGAFPRDDVDALIVSQVKTLGNGSIGTGAGTAGPGGGLYTSQAQTGLSNNGYGTLNGLAAIPDTDGDGMPDYWELAAGLNPNVANPLTNTITGYTPLENYLNFLAAPHAVTQTNAPVDINLAQFTAGFPASATFVLSGATNGVATLLNSTNAHFVPAANFSGLGGFNFTVTDGSYALSVAVTVCITPVPPPASATQFNGAIIGVALASAPVPSNLLWRGDGTANAWNTSATNWLNGASLATYKNTDVVTFDDTGSNTPAINLAGTVSPGAMLFNDDKNYTLSGAGALSGAGSLSKTGAGTLTVGTTNSGFTGSISVSGGALTLASGTSIGSSAISLSGGAIFTAASGSTSITVPGAISVAGSDTATLSSGQLGNTFSGNVTSGDANTLLNLSGGVSFSGATSAQLDGFTGTLNIPANTSLRFSVNGPGNTLGSLNPNFIVNGKLQPRNAGNIVTLGAISGAGQLAGQQTPPASGGSTGNIVYVIGGNNSDSLFSGTLVDSNPTNLTCLTKSGTGTLTLTGNNSYTGSNYIAAGTLIITGTNTPSLVTVATNAIFGGTGTNFGSVTVKPGGKLSPGGNGAGTLTINGSLTNNTPTLYYDLASLPAGANDRLNLNGTLALSGPQTFIFNLADGALGAGTYNLIEGATNLTLASVSFTNNLPGTTRQTFAITTPSAGSNPAYVRLLVGGSAAALTWSGTNGSTWDANTTVNWLSNGVPNFFYNLDTVRFDDTATNGTVSVTGTVQPITMIVSNASRSYSVGGSGAFAGFGALVKQGSGALTLSSANSFTGGSTLNAGTLTLGNYLALGGGLITLNGGTLAFGPSVKPGNAMLVASNGSIIASSLGGLGGVVTGSGNLALTVSGSGNTFDISGDLSSYGGTLTVNSSACYIRFNYSNNSIVDNRGANINLGNGSAHLLNRNAGSFTFGGLSGGPNTILSGATSYAYPTYYFIGANNANTTFNGSVQDGVAFTAVTKVGTGTLTLGGASTFTGDMDVAAGTLCVSNLAGCATGIGNSLEIFAGATLTGQGTIGSATTVDDGAILAPGAPNGTLTFTNNLTLNDNSLLRFGLGSSSDAVAVGGDLLLTGQLTVTNSGGFGVGSYPLFTCAGALNLGSLVLVAAPAGYNYSFDTNTTGIVKLVVALPAPPVISNPTVSGGKFIFSGSGGQPGATFYIVTATNLAAPAANWMPMLTNQFDAGGNFAVTNDPATNRQVFYRLQLQ